MQLDTKEGTKKEQYLGFVCQNLTVHKNTKTKNPQKGDDGSSTQSRFENDNENNESNEKYFDDDDTRRRRKRRNTAERDDVRERGVAWPVEQHFE